MVTDPDSGVDEPAATRPRAPWHLWIVGPFFVLLYCAGAYDHVMALSENSGYFRSQNYDAAQIAYFTDYPIFPAIFWTIGVWGTLVASVLVLLRKRWAFPLAFVGFVAQVILVLVTFGFMDRWQALGARLALFDVGILLLTAGFVLYCRAMSARGVLR